MKTSALLILSFLLLSSCQPEVAKNQLLLPSFDQFDVIPGKTRAILTNPDFKLVTFLSGDCFECISELNQWQRLSDSLQFSDDLSFEPYVYSYDFDRFRDFINSQSTLNIEFPLILDVNKAIYDNILLPQGIENSKSAYLLNRNNEIIVEGYPFGNADLLNKYVAALRKEKLLL